MSHPAHNPAFVAYALATVVNTLNILALWNLSGVARGRSKSTANPEDAAMFKTRLAEADPPEVARVLRAHRNTADNTLPFLILGLVFVLLGPNPLEAQIVFGTFTAARLLYSVAYLKELQPWRTIAYGLGVLSTVALMVEVVRLIATAG